MSSILVCPICGKQQTCGPHEGPLLALKESISPCPLKKGGIYAYVRDDRGRGVPGVKVTCAGDGPYSGANGRFSDEEGFAIFDPREDGSHDTAIHVAQSQNDVPRDYYAFSAEVVSVPVSKGKITLVEFQLNRYGILHVVVKRSDKPPLLFKGAQIRVESDQKPDPGPENSLDSGPVPFHGRKRIVHTVRASLTGPDKENYAFDGEPLATPFVVPDKENLVEFSISPAGWIKFKIIDEKDKLLLPEDATLEVEAPGMAKENKDVKAGNVLEVQKLEPGAVKVHAATVPQGYALVDVKPE